MAKMLCRFGALLGLTMAGSLMVASSSSAGVAAPASLEERPPGATVMQAPVSDAFDVVAAEEALAKADPQELALAEAKLSYTTYLMTGAMASVGIDPTRADPEIV